MNSFLQSSIFGKDFVNYRKNNAHFQRVSVSSRIRNSGLLPVVIDSVERDLSVLIGGSLRKYGKNYAFDKTILIEDIYNRVVNDLKETEIEDINKEDILAGKKLKIGLEDGTIITDMSQTLEQLYLEHRNEKDNILYLLITRENTMYGYIMSIIKYLTDALFRRN
jgi:hypothetical protein